MTATAWTQTWTRRYVTDDGRHYPDRDETIEFRSISGDLDGILTACIVARRWTGETNAPAAPDTFAEWLALIDAGEIDSDLNDALDPDAYYGAAEQALLEDGWTQDTYGLVAGGEAWRVAREDERATAEYVKELMREAHGRGASEVEIARLAGVDRMTVRRALGKL